MLAGGNHLFLILSSRKAVRCSAVWVFEVWIFNVVTDTWKVIMVDTENAPSPFSCSGEMIV
jgi:hypothetical protein